jgi:hypothetical protein
MKNKLGIAIVLLAIFVAGFGIGNWGDSSAYADFREEIELLQKSAEVAIEFSDEIVQKNLVLRDSMETISDSTAVLQTEYDRLTKVTNGMQTILDSMKMNISPVTIAELPKPIRDYIQALEITVDTLITHRKASDALVVTANLALENMTTQRDNEKSRADSLVSVLALVPEDIPSDPDKFLGFIPMPSRTMSALLGAATVIVVDVLTPESE